MLPTLPSPRVGEKQPESGLGILPGREVTCRDYGLFAVTGIGPCDASVVGAYIISA